MFGSVFGILIALAIAVAIYYLLKKGVYLLYNAIIGIVILFILNATGLFGDPGIPINLVTILISAIGGILGVVIIILLHFLGVPL
ncbi:MAG: sigmaK-factor processing regulatory BofA [Methanocalculus sp. MSAO_Arc1]|uniref:pro-sigmaK processing inhibitor BofA family protein n=1 Tax=Methanocalculus TaxID=71151 RepID=UPI000FF3CBE2|nr:MULTISPECIES: pro-sigmaK processing inhibitor BofA family protein [unclassified Methanocalculus]MCP1661522.1 inhibitor of the pro-sigma K processing machinery [Methanocalculus sp. AMF5]RQD81006.1 MAG: sigmaK-factor processing regulatory BofA [Methanocalculus sp. MSAO_Arc1]